MARPSEMDVVEEYGVFSLSVSRNWNFEFTKDAELPQTDAYPINS
jgi:hypothetical protein